VTGPADGAEVSRYFYTPWGSLQRGNSLGYDTTSNKFTGKQFDEASGLIYFGARYYDPRSKRFITPDDRIILGGGVQGFNRHVFVLNNPLRYVDLTGHSPDAPSKWSYEWSIDIPGTPSKVGFEFKGGKVVPKLSGPGFKYAFHDFALDELDFVAYSEAAQFAALGRGLSWLGPKLLEFAFTTEESLLFSLVSSSRIANLGSLALGLGEVAPQAAASFSFGYSLGSAVRVLGERSGYSIADLFLLSERGVNLFFESTTKSLLYPIRCGDQGCGIIEGPPVLYSGEGSGPLVSHPPEVRTRQPSVPSGAPSSTRTSSGGSAGRSASPPGAGGNPGEGHSSPGGPGPGPGPGPGGGDCGITCICIGCDNGD
jgi:RHS repeat-associated protein